MSYTTWSCRFFYVMYLALALGWMLKPKELLAALAYKVGGSCVVERVVKRVVLWWRVVVLRPSSAFYSID